MKLTKVLLLGMAALALGACGDDEGPTGTDGPTARVRFVHMVPDTGNVNAIFVDQLENLPSFQFVAFRSSSGVYQRVRAGQRAFRVFPQSDDATIAKQRLIDTTLTLDADQHYTLVYSGNARGNTDFLAVIQDTRPAPGANQVAIRVLNAAVGLGALDVFVADSSKVPEATPAHTFTNVAFRQAAAYTNLAKLDTAVAASHLYEFAVAPAGTGTVSFRATPNQKGIAANGAVSAQAGTQIGGSMLTAIIAPAAVAGSRAATSTNTTPTVLYLIDNVPGT